MDSQRDLDAGVAGGNDELLDLVEAGLWHPWSFVAAQNCEQTSDLVQGIPCRLGDLRELLARFLGQVGKTERGSLGPHRHHGHVVGDDVVELAGDTSPLLYADPPGSLYARPLLLVDQGESSQPPPTQRVGEERQEGSDRDRGGQLHPVLQCRSWDLRHCPAFAARRTLEESPAEDEPATRRVRKEFAMKVLVAYASRHGSTQGIAERIAEGLRKDGLEADVVSTLR